MNHKVLVSITTANNSDWKKQFADLKALKISEFAVFLTGLNKDERNELFLMLKTLPNVTIPFVHARNDMETTEFEQYINHFDTQFFNVHPMNFFEPKHDLSTLYRFVLLENTPPGHLLAEEELKKFTGICLDLSHLEDDRLMHPESFVKMQAYIGRYTVLANHISAVGSKSVTAIISAEKGNVTTRSLHTMENLTQLDYLKEYSADYFGPLIALELTNEIKTQLEAKVYIENILAKK